MTPRYQVAPVIAFMLAAVMVGAQSESPPKRHAKTPPRLLLQIQDKQLFLGAVRYRNIGVTIPDLFARFLRADDQGATAVLTDAQAVGVHFVRCAGTTADASSFALFRTDRARWLAAFDRMLAAADSHGIVLVPSLLYDIHTLPDYLNRSEGRSERIVDLLTAGTASNNLAVDYVTTLVTHVRRDPRILFWEIGNEYNRDADRDSSGITSDAVAAFLRRIADLIHRLDPHRLVTSGNGDLPPDAWHRHQARLRAAGGEAIKTTAPDDSELDTFDEYGQMLGLLNPPGIDIISVHQSQPGADTPGWLLPDGAQALKIPWIMYAADQIGRPLFVGAFGQTLRSNGHQIEAPWMLDFMRRMQAEGAPLTAVRLWEPSMSDPSAATDALSLHDTPRMAVALKTANAVIVASLTSQTTLAVGPPLQATDLAVYQDRLSAQTTQLHAIAAAVLARLELRPGQRTPIGVNTTGITLRLPADGASWFRVRAAAMMAGADFIAPDEIAKWAGLVAARQAGPQGIRLAGGANVPPYAIPDHIGLDGSSGWSAHVGSELAAGSLPPADSAFYFISLVRQHLRLTGRPTLFLSTVETQGGRTPLAAICDHAFDSVAVDAKTGLVLCGAQNVPPRVDWGMNDAVEKTGFLLMPSLLRFQAAHDLIDLYEAAGDPNQMTHYASEADKIKAALADAFYLPLGQTDGQDTGLLISATILGRKDDLWASAYAVALGALPQDKEAAVARHLLALVRAGGSVDGGQLRSLPPDGPYGGAWEQCRNPVGGPQNGAFGGLPVGWLATAIAKVDTDAAAALVADYVSFLQTHRTHGAPWEWTDPAHDLFVNANDAAAVVLPYTTLAR